MNHVGCFFIVLQIQNYNLFRVRLSFTEVGIMIEVLSGRGIYIRITTLKDFISFWVKNRGFECQRGFLRL